ncbi:hypothetical protein [Neorhodopirellula lusitana]|uniref:hypothetical protein n=1 Tax=Neorhodopirellula lusitana TaxID=445327 RepID=UPI0038500A94
MLSLVTSSLSLSGCPTSGLSSLEMSATGLAKPGQSEARGESSPVSGDQLSKRVDRILRENLDGRRLDVTQQGAWQVLHGILAYGQAFEVETPAGVQPAVDYLLEGGPLEGFEPSIGDPLPAQTGGSNDMAGRSTTGVRFEFAPSTKTGQGHRDQWLAILAQSNLTPSDPVVVRGRKFQVDDVVRQTEFDIPLNLEEEFSWTLIGLLAFRDTDHVWTARDGNDYSVDLLLEVELNQSIADSVCGGTHRLNAIAMALAKRRSEGKPINGVWQMAEQQIAASIEDARMNQNPDGSYSLAYLHRPGWARDLSEQLGTTGHVLEFVSLAADDETLQSAWVRRSVTRICDLLDACRDIDLECGVLYHALHGLQEYQTRLKRMSSE